MKKKMYKAGLCALLATGLLLAGGPAPVTDFTACAADAAKTQSEVKKIKGKITNISQKAKTIALENPENPFFLVKFTDDTALKELGSAEELKADEAVVIEYTSAGDENIATSIAKAHVKLPEGIKEIKTDALAELMKSSDKLVVVDARPAARYAEGHVPGAISIPFSKLTKMGDDGAKLLEPYKDKQLVFYCGGST